MRVATDLKTLNAAIASTIERVVSDTYTAEEARDDVKHFQGEAKKIFDRLEREVEAAVKRCPNWTGSNVTIIPEFGKEPLNWDHVPATVNSGAYLYVHKGSSWHGTPNFMVLTEDDGDPRGVDDVLDAGDSDFFRDPEIEADYFALSEEIRHPGKAKSLGNKVVTLYTARPVRDRETYMDATTMPVNVFLTTDPDEAWGYSRDMGNRDIWRVKVRHKYLVQTLDAGRVKNYQTFSGQGNTVPLEDLQLIREADKTASYSYDRRKGAP